MPIVKVELPRDEDGVVLEKFFNLPAIPRIGEHITDAEGSRSWEVHTVFLADRAAHVHVRVK